MIIARTNARLGRLIDQREPATYVSSGPETTTYTPSNTSAATRMSATNGAGWNPAAVSVWIGVHLTHGIG